MKDILLVNACVKRDCGSRTERLARAYLAKRLEQEPCALTTIDLQDTALAPLSEKDLAARDKAIQTGDFSGAAFELARSFAAAEEIVIAAPYWDMSFPASLKLYAEQICVNGLTFYYNEAGLPCGATRIKKAVYLTTAGGYIGNNNFGFDYIKGLFSTLFGIGDISFFSAEGLDICTNDAEKIMNEAIEKMLRTMSK